MICDPYQLSKTRNTRIPRITSMLFFLVAEIEKKLATTKMFNFDIHTGSNKKLFGLKIAATKFKHQDENSLCKYQ